MLTLVVNPSPLCQYARLSSGKLNVERGPGLGHREVSVPVQVRQSRDSGLERRMQLMGRNFTFLRRLLIKHPGRQRRLAVENHSSVVRGFADIPVRRLIDPGKLESGL